jgi:IS30 family transposase
MTSADPRRAGQLWRAQDLGVREIARRLRRSDSTVNVNTERFLLLLTIHQKRLSF